MTGLARSGLAWEWTEKAIIEDEVLSSRKIDMLRHKHDIHESLLTCGKVSGDLQTMQNNLLAFNPTTQ